jgi:rhodanese-related sulfurtransferase
MKKLLTLALSMVFASAAMAAEFPDISIADLNKAIAEKKVTVIDVMGSNSYKNGHVPTAIDFAANQDKLASQLPKDKDALIVAYCGGPACNAYQKAAKAATALGYTNVKHLTAGISGWKKEGQPLEK